MVVSTSCWLGGSFVDVILQQVCQMLLVEFVGQKSWACDRSRRLISLTGTNVFPLLLYRYICSVYVVASIKCTPFFWSQHMVVTATGCDARFESRQP